MIALLLAAAAAQPVPVQAGGHRATAWASSQLAAKDPRRYAAANAFDGDPATAWVEGAPGTGEGESLFLELAEPAPIDGFVLMPGYMRSAKTLVENAAPRRIELSADGKLLLEARIPWVERWPDEGERCLRTDAPHNLAPRLIVLSRPLSAKKLQLRIVEAGAGTRFEDNAISEWGPIFTGEKTAGSLEPARAALASLREGKPLLAPDAKADPILPWAHAENPPAPDYDAFVKGRLGGADLAPAQVLLKAFGPELLDHAVLVSGGKLLGGMSFTHGDGEWKELYPELILDAQGRIAELRTAFHEDGAPGCRRALPEKL
jgi:hypothetical protein